MTEMAVKEASRMLGQALSYTYSLIWSGKLKARKVDGRWLVDAEAVEARLKQRGE